MAELHATLWSQGDKHFIYLAAVCSVRRMDRLEVSAVMAYLLAGQWLTRQKMLSRHMECDNVKMNFASTRFLELKLCGTSPRWCRTLQGPGYRDRVTGTHFLRVDVIPIENTH